MRSLTREHGVQVHAEKVLRTWSHEALFNAETLSKYEVRSTCRYLL